MDMRGLKNFIKDIREAADNRDAEVRRVDLEMSKIRAKFKSSSSLSAYDRKKYVCKLLFVFMLGYPVEFGHMECIQLLSGESASEKLIGYLALSLLLNDSHPLLTLTTNTVTNDLQMGDDLRKCLALTAVANIGGRDFADAMSTHIVNLASSKTTATIVRKKAMLAALRLHRKFTGCIDVATIGPAAAEAVSSTDMSLSLAATTLCVGLISDAAQIGPEEHTATLQSLASSQLSALRMLERIILDKASPAEFVHCGVPSPWLQGKLVRLLQEFPPPSAAEHQEAISGILARIVRATSRAIQEAQANVTSRTDPLLIRSNCMVSVLAEIVSIAIQWNVSNRLLSDCRDALALLLNDRKDPNRRYVGLTLLTRMSYCTVPDAETSDSASFAQQIAKYQPVIVAALHDPDESLRKRALELLYAMCDASNAAQVVGELLEYLPIAEPKFREDLVLMIAILAEKFCGDITWYVDVLVSVIDVAGDVVTEDVWQRLVHVCINAQSVQSHAVEVVFRALSRAHFENHALTKVAAVLLGEFGYQIALVTGSAPMDQLNLLQSKYITAPDPLKAMLLTTFVKFYNLYDNPAVREKIKKIIAPARSSIDPELQQRAAEYYALITAASDETLQAALEPLPPFEMQASAMTDKLRAKHKGETRDLWLEKGGERDKAQLRQSSVLRTASAVDGVGNATASPAAHADPNDTSMSSGAVLSNAKTNVLRKVTQVSDTEKAPVSQDGLDALFGTVAPPPAATETASAESTAERAFKVRLNGEGVMYDSDKLTISVKSEHRGSDARATATIVNKHSKPLQNLEVRILNTPASLMVQQQPLALQGPLGVGKSADALFASRCLQCFREPAQIVVGGIFAGEGAVNLTLELPFYVTTFLDPYKLDDVSKFASYWGNTKSGNNGSCTASANLNNAVASSGDKCAAIEAILFAQRFFTIRLSPTEVGGISAHCAMPADQAVFTPIMVKVRLESGADDPFSFGGPSSSPSSGSFRLEVKSPDPVLELETYRLLLAVLRGDKTAP